MSNYTVTVIKTGNSYALRVPKKYVEDAHLKLGDKVGIPLAQKYKKQDHAKIQQIIKDLQAATAAAAPRGLAGIKDPVAWQREIRKDRPLPGRE
ncbi:MAG TPA: hypothetical protein VGG13_01035 [Candidatus Saccharimonadales bacterium]|jgi:antitoxin component of MazEF toxin-antitoxin module